MLLGSPPDTVHGAALRGTGLSSLLIQVRRHITRPGAGIHPCCSGLQVQGTAISPTSAALLSAGGGQSDWELFYYNSARLATDFFTENRGRVDKGRETLYNRSANADRGGPHAGFGAAPGKRCFCTS